MAGGSALEKLLTAGQPDEIGEAITDRQKKDEKELESVAVLNPQGTEVCRRLRAGNKLVYFAGKRVVIKPLPKGFTTVPLKEFLIKKSS